MGARATRKTDGGAGTSRERMARYRQRMREKGLRPVQLWLPDTKDPAFIARIERQCRKLAAHDPAGDEVQAWIDQNRDWPD